MLPVIALVIWPWLVVSIVSTAAVCSLAARGSFRRLRAWFVGAAVLGPAFGLIVVTAMALPRPWMGAIAGFLAALAGTYPVYNVWIIDVSDQR